ncbi:hypothetical protein Zmor_017352 [Zophobas morio]|uniref:NACHT domain-containing protein n=1 Tax=Zophobas morio TaxID=2755281 RepID=A0AA38I8Q6_9CUCU|nr:hypothetical protein Zmor_017352 [Zophobas morio]
MATAAKGRTVEERGKTLQNPSSHFKKRSGTTDVGKDYEHLYIANLVLKLIIDNDVENFYLSSNDNVYGSFDDVVVDIQFKDRMETFAIQLKHVSKSGGIPIEKLNASSGNFSIEKYYKDFKKEPKLSEPHIKMVLFTNSKLNEEHIDHFKFGKLTPCEQNSLLSTRISKLGGQCYRFEANEDKFKEYGSFFKNLYLYTGQTDAKKLEMSTLEIFKSYFESNETVFREYLHFITQWSMKQGNKTKLNKMWMQYMISLCVFSPFIKPLSFVPGRSMDAKRNIFREAVSKFDLTVINKNNFEKIHSVWSNAVDDIDNMKETINVNNMYQLIEKGLETKESLYDKDATKVSKLMWLLRKCPLVIKGCPQVYQAVKICQTKNLIILDNQQTFNDTISIDFHLDNTGAQQKLHLFEKLSDLKKHVQLYEEVLMNFTYSLQGQKDVKLKYLIEMCEGNDNFITTDDLVEMTKTPLLIGKYKDALPPSHTKRKLTKILIDVKFLENVSKNTIVLVDCVADVNFFKRFSPNLEINEARDVDIQNIIPKHKVYICGNDISQEKFSALCKQNSQIRFHHFRYLENRRLEWVESGNYDPKIGYINELQRFRLQSDFIEYGEQEYFSHSRQNINIVCADSGMGKTTLMKSLKSSSSSSKWVILIYARNHALHFRKHESNMENFLKYILEETFNECTNPFHQRVFKGMLEQNQMQLIWDGLDEASDATQTSILALVTAFSEKGVKQWLTSRNNLKALLENKLRTFARNIKQFNEEEQQEYIKNRLEITDDELNECFNKIKKNIMSFPNYEILGIPLQIYMLTELFLKDKDKYLLLLDDIFTIVDLYQHFTDEKFHVLYNEKNEMTLRNEKNIQNFENEKNARMNHYKNLAATYYLYNSLIYKIGNILFSNDKTIDTFVETIKNDGDDVGFISRVISKYDVEFIHNSYGEYFAALYLFEYEPSKAREREFISDSRYKNIRFFLDLMLARDSKCLIGVIYKNPAILEEYIHTDLSQKDVIGRDVLEVACAWNKNYPLVKNNVILNGDKSFNTGWLIENHEKVVGTINYRNMAPKFYKFNKSDHACFKKLMIFLPFLIPSYLGNQFAEEYLVAVLYYAIRFDCPLIYECIENSVPLQTTYNNISSRSILALALYNRSAQVLKKVFSEERSHSEWDCVEELLIQDSEIDEILSFALHFSEFRIDVPNSKDQSLAHYACEKNLTKTLRSLILREVNTNSKDTNGKRPIHIACEKGHSDFLKHIAQIDILDKDGRLPLHYACKDGDLDVASVLIKYGTKVDVPDEVGRLPIHYACKHGSLTMVELLATKGAKFDVPDRGGQLPMHYASRNFKGGYEIILFLCKKGMKVDTADGDGRLPIHYACEKGRLNMVELLATNGAEIDVPDKGDHLPMHYASRNYLEGYQIILFLCRKGMKVDIPDGDGRLPIHYSCECGSLDMVQLLATNGAKLDVPDRGGQLPIHYACRNWGEEYKIIFFLCKKGVKVDVPDGDGRLPIHYACEHGSLTMVKLLATNGAKFDVPDRGGHLPIHSACRNRWWGLEITLFLCKNGVKMDVLDRDGRLPIHHACKRGSLDMVQLLATNGAKLEVPDRGGQLPIHYACRNRWEAYKIIFFLCKKGVKVDVPDGDGRLPIHYACEEGSLTMVELLATNGAKFNVPDRGGQLPIHSACRNRRWGFEITLFLCKNGVKMDVLDRDGRLPIHHACERGSLDMVQLLATNGAKLDVPDRDGQLPLHYASRNRLRGFAMILFLCNKGVKVNVPDRNERLPIHHGCEHGNLSIVQLLVKNGAKFNVPDRGGQLPMHYACKNYDAGYKMILFLCKNGVKMDVLDRDGRLPIHHACERGSLDMVQLLATNGAKLDVPDRGGQLPLHYASRNRLRGFAMILFLCNKGVKVNVPDRNERLPIHHGCEHGNLSIVQLLVKNGAKFNVPDRGGQLPMHYATRNQWEGYEIIPFLYQKGAKVDVPDGDGRLPIHYACERGPLRMVALLVTNGARLDFADKNGQLPMHYACRNSRKGYEIILFLLEKGAKVDVPDGDGRLPINYACEHGNLNIKHEKVITTTDPMQDSSEKFKKRGGTTDAGRDYEHLYIANLILKLINDGNVQNFYLSSNDSAYGSFDDVVVEIIFKDRTETFAIQLKHVSRTGGIQIEQLNASSGNFSVEKYYKDFKKEPKLSERPTKMVLFTNSKLNDEHIDRFKFGKLTPCKQDGLLSTRISESGGQCYRFEENEDKFEEYGSFFKNLYLYTGQTDAKELETCTFEMFKAYFGSNETVFREYLHFITHWSMKEGNKFKLNKMWMKYMISLCVFSSSIKPLSFAAGGTVNAKRKIFKEAVSKFDLTLINKHNFEKIAPVWSNAVDDIDDMAETIKVNYKYQLINNGIETKDSLYDKDPTKVSKLMWLLGKSPLVVEGCPQVYQTIKICQVQNLLILDNQETFNECVGKSNTDPPHDSTDGQQKLYLFGKLSDLEKHVQLYEEILTNFTYSLQGQKDVAMKYLLEICQDSGNFISTDDLVEMTEAPLLIGKYKDVLPPSHVERKLAKVLIEVKFLQNINENTIVLVDCATDVNSFKQFLPNLVISEVNDVVIIQPAVHDRKIYVCGKEVSQEEFSALCKKKSEIHFHHFRYLDNHRLEWLESGNYGPEQKFINELKTFRLQSEFTVYTIGEGQYFNHSRQNINIICADAGMGKSTLAKSLKKSSKSTYWIIIIYARNHALHFRKQGSNLDSFLKYVLEDTSRECRNQFHQRVFEKMLEQNQIQLIWDGLDEATDTTQISILTLVDLFSEKGVKQWLTSRTNLKDILENELEECIHADLRQKDFIGRDVLEVACAWNKSYRLVENNIILNDKSFNTEWLINNKDKVVGTLNYRDIAPKFYKFSSTGHVCFKKLMIFLPFLIPLYDGNEFDEEYLVAVLYYAIRFDCPTIYECIENSVPLKTTYNNISSRSILALALFNRSAKILKKVLSEQRNHFEWDCVEELLILDSEIDEILSFALQFPEFRIDVPNSKGQLLAHYACEKNLTKTLRSLILREVNTNYKDRNGKRPIHIALEKGHLDFLKHIAQTDVLDKDGRLPLHYACEDGDLGIIEILLANGAKVDVPDGNRQLPIHYALRKWHTVIINVLIRNGAKVDVPDASGRLPIHYACEHGSLTMVELMAKKGATFDAPDRGGQRALHYACRNDRWGYEIILFLFKKGVKVDVPDGNGRLPIHYACEKGRLSMVELLAMNGAKFDIPDTDGQLPIHYACRNDRWGYEIILFLYKNCESGCSG